MVNIESIKTELSNGIGQFKSGLTTGLSGLTTGLNGLKDKIQSNLSSYLPAHHNTTLKTSTSMGGKKRHKKTHKKYKKTHKKYKKYRKHSKRAINTHAYKCKSFSKKILRCTRNRH